MQNDQTIQDGQVRLYSWSYEDDDYRDKHMIAANEARRRSEDINNATNSGILKSIEKNVEDACTRGARSVFCTKVNDIIKKELEKLGYTVTYYGGDPRDYSDSTGHNISW